MASKYLKYCFLFPLRNLSANKLQLHGRADSTGVLDASDFMVSGFVSKK